jgi:hypothetical protein
MTNPPPRAKRAQIACFYEKGQSQRLIATGGRRMWFAEGYENPADFS